MTEPHNSTTPIYSTAVTIRNITACVSLMNFVYVIVKMGAFDKDPTPPVVDSVLMVIGIVNSVLFSLSLILSSLYGSKTLDVGRSQSVVEELKERYNNSNLKQEALRIIAEIDEISVPVGHDLYDCFLRFRKAVLSNLMYRVNLEILIGMLGSFFVFYNYLVLLIYNTRLSKQNSIYSQAVYLTLNVINPSISLAFSYIVVLCDNVNSILVYIHRARKIRDTAQDKIGYAIATMHGYSNQIERPFFSVLDQAQ